MKKPLQGFFDISNIFFSRNFQNLVFGNFCILYTKYYKNINEKYNFAFTAIPLQGILDKCPSFLIKQRATKSMQNFLRNINLKMKKLRKKVSEIISVKCELIKNLFIQGIK